MKKFMTQVGLGVVLGMGAMTTPLLLTRPAIAQQVTSVTPTGTEAQASSSITWQFDNPALVAPNSIKLFVDGVDVTAQSVINISSNTFGYKPSKPLSAGTHNVEVRFRNTSGTNYQAKWSFEVSNVPLTISAVYHNAVADPLATGEEFRVEVRGTPKAKVTVLLVQNGTTVRTLTPTETASGIYKANLPLTSRDQVNEGVVVARIERNGQVMFRTVEAPFAFNPQSNTAGAVTQTVVNTGTTTSTQPLALEVTSPTNNQQFNAAAGFKLTGRTAPDATVKVTVLVDPPPASLLQTLGGILTGSSSNKTTTVLNQAPATVNSDGTFSIDVPLAAGVSAGQTYRVAVQTQRGTETQTVNLTLKQK